MASEWRVELKKGRFLVKHYWCYFYLHREAEAEFLVWTGKKDPLFCICKQVFASRISSLPTAPSVTAMWYEGLVSQVNSNVNVKVSPSK